ncbi:MAG: RNA polymerase sigma factor [Magnetospirillum sp.]|nr:RNA polymerase sigma factor [Magnetospirillum sp.]
MTEASNATVTGGRHAASRDLCPLRERHLLDRIAARDHSAFWELWRVHYEHLLRVTLRLCRGNAQEAHDIVGDASLRLIEDMPRHACAIRDSRRWLRRTLMNVAIDRFRSRRRHAVPVGSLEGLSLLAEAQGIAAALTPEREASGREFIRQVGDVIEEMPERLRLTATLYFVLGQSHGEVARKLAISPALARKRIQQVRDRLKSMRDAGAHGDEMVISERKSSFSLTKYNAATSKA